MFPDTQPDRPSLLNRQIKHRALLGSHRNNILLKKVTMMGYQEPPGPINHREPQAHQEEGLIYCLLKSRRQNRDGIHPSPTAPFKPRLQCTSVPGACVHHGARGGFSSMYFSWCTPGPRFTPGPA